MDDAPGEMIGEAQVRLQGAVGTATAREVQDQLMAALAAGQSDLTVDLAEVTSIDSAGLGVFVTVFKTVQKRGGRMNLANMSDNLLGIFEQTHLDKLFLINGLTAAERQQAEADAARLPGPVSAAPVAPRPRATGELPPAKRLHYLYAGLVLSLLLLAGTQFLFYKRFGENDLVPYLKSNVSMTRALLVDQYRVARQYPAGGEEVQQLLQQKGVTIKNVYTREPIRVLTGKLGGMPGDLLYEPTTGGFRLRVVARDGTLLQEQGQEFMLTERKRK